MLGSCSSVTVCVVGFCAAAVGGDTENAMSSAISTTLAYRLVSVLNSGDVRRRCLDCPNFGCSPFA